MTQNPETVSAHLKDLRSVVIHCMWAWGITSLISLFFSQALFDILKAPLVEVLPQGASLITTHPIEAWLVYLKVGILGGFLFSFPYMAYEFWLFVLPGLYKHEKRLWSFLGFGLGLLFLCGALFGYFLVLPIGLKTIVGLTVQSDVLFLPTLSHTLSFMTKVLFAFGIAFELPLIVFAVAALKIVTLKQLMHFQKYLLVVSLVVAAVLTPPDPVTQVLMALPLILLYQVGLGIAWLYLKMVTSPLASHEE